MPKQEGQWGQGKYHEVDFMSYWLSNSFNKDQYLKSQSSSQPRVFLFLYVIIIFKQVVPGTTGFTWQYLLLDKREAETLNDAIMNGEIMLNYYGLDNKPKLDKYLK